ncbi:MAG TPA: hypothetical protein IAB49_03305 [Candidatus Caccenecus avistercoris]|nr:hypothetical protein [Candidatus Caccenecus avistercoris]
MKSRKKILVLGIVILLVLIAIPVGIKTFSKKENNDITEKEVQQNKTYTTIEELLENVEDDHLYTISSEYSFAFEPTPETLYEESDVVLIGTFNKNLKTYSEKERIKTSTLFNVSEVLKNNSEKTTLSTNVTIERTGGLMDLQQFISENQNTLREDEFKDVAVNQRKNYYILQEFGPNNLLDFNNSSDEYILFLTYVDGKLMPMCEYYGIRKVENNKIYNYDTKAYEQSEVLE